MTNTSTKRTASENSQALAMPLAGALLMSLVGAVVVGASFCVIKYWPLPASVAPVMGFEGGACWGAVVGALSGLVIGYLIDEKHFD